MSNENEETRWYDCPECDIHLSGAEVDRVPHDETGHAICPECGAHSGAVYDISENSNQRPAMTTDYHQKPISAMTDGELRAYRRELARAALTGLHANPANAQECHGDMAFQAFDQANAMIEHERREEGGAE